MNRKQDNGRHARPVMTLRVTALDEGPQDLRFEASRDQLQLDETFDPVVVTEGVGQRTGRQIVLDLHVRGGWTHECDRCLVEVHRDVDEPLVLYYTEEEGAARHSDDPDVDEVRAIDPDQEAIVLDEDVRQTMLLSVPFKILCREECLGLCPRCGADLNAGQCNCEAEIDPRWAKLAGLFKTDAGTPDPDQQN